MKDEREILNSLGLDFPQENIPKSIDTITGGTEESILNSMGFGLPRHPELKPAKVTIPQVALETLGETWEDLKRMGRNIYEQAPPTLAGKALIKSVQQLKEGKPLIPKLTSEQKEKIGHEIFTEIIPKTTAGLITYLPEVAYTLAKNPHQTIVERPIDVAFLAMVIYGGAKGLKARAKLKTGEITKADLNEAIDAAPEDMLPNEVKPKLKNIIQKTPEETISETTRKLSAETFKGEQAYKERVHAPIPKTEQEAMLAQAEKLGTYPIRGFAEEVKKPIIKKGYSKEYIAEQNKILNAEADILKRTGKTETEINEFIKNDFMDGEKLRETTNQVLAGKIKPEDAAKDIAGWIDATTGKAGERGIRVPTTVEEIAQRKALLEEQARIVREKGPLIPEATEVDKIRRYLEDKPPQEQSNLLTERKQSLVEEIRRAEDTGTLQELEKENTAIDALLKEVEVNGKILPAKEIGMGEIKPEEMNFIDGLERENKAYQDKGIDTSYQAWKKEQEGGFLDISKPEKGQTTRDKLSTVYQDVFDKFHAIKKISDIARAEVFELPAGTDPYLNARTYLGVQGMAEAKIFHKRFIMTPKGNIVWRGPGLAEILEPVKGKIDEFDHYLVYRRAIELNKRGIETGIDSVKAKELVERYQKEFEPHAQKVTEYMHSLLDDLVDSGKITKDVATLVKEKNKFYVRFERVMDDLHKYGNVPTSKNSFLKIPSNLFRIKGSKRVIISPLESAIKATYITTNTAWRNRVANMIVGLRELSPEISRIIKPIRPKMKIVATLEDGTRVFRPSVFQDKGIIEVWQKGERHFYEVPKDLYDSMSQLTETTNYWLTKILAVPARILRTGATSVPEFALRNPIRDQLFAFVNAKYGYVPLVDFTRGLFEMIGKGEQYWRWKAAGGEWSQLVTLDRATNRAMLKQVLGHKDFVQYIKKPIKLLEDFSMYGEMPTRIGAFKKALKKGVTDIEAAMESREASIDFARRGLKTKTVSSLYTFLNARLQGLDQMVRSFKERPVETLAKTVAIATVPSILNYFVNRDDRSYWEIPEWQRDLFWIIPAKRTKFDEKGNVTEKGLYLRVPKGDIGVVFGTTAEKVLAWMDRDKATKPELDKLMGQIFQQVSPIGNVGEVLPVAFRGLFEVMANKKFFVNRPIVPQGQEALEPKYQYTPFTSETSKLIGKTFNVSPAKIDHLITSYTAGLGRHGLKLNDAVLKEMGLVEKKPEVPKKLADYPILQAFVVRDPMGFNSETIQNFYETLNKINRFYSTVSRLREQGKTDELKKLIKDHPVESVAVKNRLDAEFRRTQTDLAQMRKMRDIIYENKEMSSEEKGKVIDGLEQAGFRLAFITMMKYKYLETKQGKNQ
jgi:predicted Rdx family selenoprotein